MAWKIYHEDGRALTDRDGNGIEVHSLEYDGEWMGACSVTADIESATAVDFRIGDWLEYRGERFVLGYDPGKQKCGRSGATGSSFKYSSVKWDALSDEMARAEFIDIVPGKDNGLHYTALPTFTFYMENLDDLLDRLQACMDEQTGEGLWHFYSRNWSRSAQRGCDGAVWEKTYGGKAVADGSGIEDTVIDSTSVSVDRQTVWQGLSLVNSQFDVNFIVRNRNVFVGTAGLPTGRIFRYGKGNGLYEIDQNADSDQQIVTRLRAYGSVKNMPTRYYATLNTDVWALPVSVWTVSMSSDGSTLQGVDISTDLPGASLSAYFRIPVTGSPGEYAVDVKVGISAASGSVRAGEGTDSRCIVQLRAGDGNNGTALKAIADAAKGGGKIYFTRGVTRYNFPDDHKSAATGNLPDNMACDRLMLPGFPNQSLQDWWNSQDDATHKRLNPTGAHLRFSTRKDRPWIESANADETGVRPGSVFFDQEDTKNKIDEIYPTLEEMTVGGERVDVIAEGSAVEDNGVFRDGVTVPGFTVALSPKLDMDINGLKDSDFSVVMKDGMCAGRTFQVSGSEKKDGRWVLTLTRVKDNDVYYPYKDFQIKRGDHFVLTGIEMPELYVEAASEKLLMYAIRWLTANDYTRYTYQPKVDEIYMARQHDEAMADKTGATKSLHDTLKEGDLLQFEDSDLGIDGAVTISRLVIKEQDGKIPSYEVTLREDKEVGSMEKMQEQINSLVGGNGGGGGGLTLAQARSVVESEGGKHFLSKVHRDTAQEEITFSKGIFAGEYAEGVSGARIDGAGNAEVGSLRVRGKARLGDRAYVERGGAALLGDVQVDGVRSAGAGEEDRTLVGGEGFEMYRDRSGKSHLYVDNAVIRGKLLAAETEIRKVSYSGGTMVFSNAGSTLVRVVCLGKDCTVVKDAAEAASFKCYASADDGTTRTMNWWKAGDMAMCKTFNVSGSTGGNRYYWRLVLDCGQEMLEDGRVYDYVVLSNLEKFIGVDHVVPVSIQQAVADSDGNIITWGGKAVTVATGIEMKSFYAVVQAGDGSSKDDNGKNIQQLEYYGYDPDGTDVPAAGDVIVQAGSQTRFVKRGNAIKLATSADDGDARTAPSLTMYHQIGNRWSTDAGDGSMSVWQWKTVTAVIAPTGVRFNSDYFKWFSGTEDNIIDPVVVSYELVPSQTYLIRHVSTGTVEPEDISFVLVKHTGNKKEDWNGNGVTLKAAYTLRGGGTGEKTIKTLKDIGDLYGLATLRVTAVDAGGEELCCTDIAVISDGEDGEVYLLTVTSDTGTTFVNGTGTMTLTATLYRNSDDVTDTIPDGSWQWYRISADTEDDAVWNKLHEGTGRTCRITGDDVARVAQFGCRAVVPDAGTAALTVDSAG